MAHTAHKTEAEFKEHFDDEETVLHKVRRLADLIKSSHHFIAFTGAGVSTACGIPDFRSGENTVLETGAGAWTLEAANKKRSSSKRCVDMLNAIPSPSHMALNKLEEEGRLKYLISQNCDGLHRRSGFPPWKLSELHGNTNLEFCLKCGKEYMRDFDVEPYHKEDHTHLTGRRCAVRYCNGKLQDTLICFSEQLPKKPKDLGFSHARKADLCLVLGSSLTVSPAADMPEMCGLSSRKKLVIVNLQSTPLDECADFRINGKCEDVMRLLMKELDLPIPEFVLKRYVKISTRFNGKYDVIIQSVDSDGTEMSLFRNIEWNFPTRNERKPFLLLDEPMALRLSGKDFHSKPEVKLRFRGHYNEPSLVIQLSIDDLLSNSPSRFSSRSSSNTSSSSSASRSSNYKPSRRSTRRSLSCFYQLQYQHTSPSWDKPKLVRLEDIKREEPRTLRSGRELHHHKSESRKNERRKDERREDERRKDEPREDEPREDEPRKDERRKDEPRKDELRKDEPHKDEPRKDEPPKDEPHTDERPSKRSKTN